MHIAGGINVNQQSHAGDHQHHGERQAVNEKTDAGTVGPRGNPGKHRQLVRRGGAADKTDQGSQREEKRHADRSNRQLPDGGSAIPPTKEAIEESA